VKSPLTLVAMFVTLHVGGSLVTAGAACAFLWACAPVASSR
jgi:hypothetical protein